MDKVCIFVKRRIWSNVKGEHGRVHDKGFASDGTSKKTEM